MHTLSKDIPELVLENTLLGPLLKLPLAPTKLEEMHN